MDVTQEEVYTAEDLMEQILQHEGIRVVITMERFRYMLRRYQDVYPLVAQGSVHERIKIVRDRLLHMVRHYNTHARKNGSGHNTMDFTARFVVPEDTTQAVTPVMKMQ